MLTGMIFDIKEFAINDGPGIRLTVFLKGCPLRCKWCHNPEGLLGVPEKNMLTGRVVGAAWTVNQLVEHCIRFKDCFDLTNGGVTFSGGEATAQSDFLIATSDRLRNMGVHVNLDTSGFCAAEIFSSLLRHVDLVYFDLKCMDTVLHKRKTGVDNTLILENARRLACSDVAYHIRVPLVPGISDTPTNRRVTLDFVASLPRPPVSVDWLPFNDLAAGKYPAYGMKYMFRRIAPHE